MPLRILSGKGAVQIVPFRKLGGKCHFLLRFCTRKRSETYLIYHFLHMLVTTLVLKTETDAEIFIIFYYSSNVKSPLTPSERESEFFLCRLSFFSSLLFAFCWV